MEHCDRGSLGSLLNDCGGFKDEQGQLDYAAVLETAADVAKGMIHLHKNNICHNDLKANNVMFKSEGNDGRGVRAKVVDFGLSVKLDNSATHQSNAFQGTMTHMVSILSFSLIATHVYVSDSGSRGDNGGKAEQSCRCVFIRRDSVGAPHWWLTLQR